MIRHPLVRFGLFAVAVVLWVFLLVPLGHSFVATSLLTAASFFGATATMLAVDHRGPAFIGLSFERGWLTQSLGGFAIGCASIAVAVAPIIFVGRCPSLDSGWTPRQWLSAIALFFVAAVGEELLFRGYGFQRLVESIGALPALVALALFFGAAHLNNPNRSWPGAVNTVLVGFVFGYAYLRTRRLWLPIGWHWGWNITEASLGFPVSGIRMGGVPLHAESAPPVWLTGGAYGPEASVAVTMVLVASLILVLRMKQAEGKAGRENEA